MNNPEKAITWVMEYERLNGRNPKDVSTKGCGYDIESDGRCIEVKSTARKRKTLSLYKKLLKQLGGKIDRYYIYVVYDIESTPKLKILDPRVVVKSLEEDARYIVRASAYTRISPANDFSPSVL